MKTKLFSLILLFALFAQWAMAQRTLTGTVSDAGGNALPGATVRVKDANAGTTADENGAFFFTAPSGNFVLMVSYTGYTSVELPIGAAQNRIDVTLESGGLLTEAVVVALGVTRSEKSLGYSVAQVAGEGLTKVRDVNIVNALSGRAAGVQVIGSNGNLGGSARITIRGIKSINGNNQPLFVVDGIPMDNSNFTNDAQKAGSYGKAYESEYDFGNAIQDLNPDDIESISVLKGQAASALYGSRGANGVIMISMKKGGKRAGRGIGVSVNSSVTFDKIAVYPKMQRKYGGGVDLLPRGYSDNTGFYKTPYVEFDGNGDTSGIFSSFDLVPSYGVDESNGTRFATSTDQHFQHLQDGGGYSFYNGFGANQSNLNFRDWNSWDSWDTDHFGKSRLWEAGDNPWDFFETGVTKNNSIAFEGGTDRSAFRLSFNRYDQKGVLPNSKLTRNTLSFNGSMDLTGKLKAFMGANYVNSATKGRSSSTYDGRGGLNPAMNFSQWWHTQLRFADLEIYENPDGTMRTWNRQSADNPRPQYWDNPYWSRFKNYETDGRDRFFGNAGLSYKVLPWLTATGRVMNDFYTENREERIAVGSISTSQYTQDNLNVSETNADFTLRADKYLSDNLSVNSFVGGNKLWRKLDRSFGATVGGLNVPGIYRLQNSKERPFNQDTRQRKEIESIFGGAGFGWKSMLYLDLTGRQDWSSTLPAGANGYFYPSASGSFVFSEMAHIPKLSFGKIRIGWAKTGNDTDPYNIYSTYEGKDNFGSLPAYTVSNTLNNRGLKPEQTNSIEVGAELRFFLDRIGLDFSYYTGNTTNQILPLATSAGSGFEKQFINAGKISNKGIEIALNLVPVKTRDFNWELGFNFGKNKNKVVSLIPEDKSITNIPLAGGVFIATVNAFIGEPFGTILGTNYLFDPEDNKLVGPEGFYLASTDVMPIGNITPDFQGGVNTGFSWKNWSLGALVDFRKGGDIISNTNMWGRYSGLFEESAIGTNREDGFLNTGTVAELDGDGLPMLVSGGDTETKLDDRYKSTGATNAVRAHDQTNRFLNSGYVINAADVYDGSFIKLREVSLGYRLPKAWLKRARISDAQLSVVGRNVTILFKNIPNLDPDMAISAQNVQGIDGGATPTTRSIGVNLNFRF